MTATASTTATATKMDDRVKDMLKCYHYPSDGFQQNWVRVNKARVFELAKRARMYCFEEEKGDAEIVFSRRNLVNIGMSKGYNLNEWKKFTDTENDLSGYDAIYETTKKFPPMIGAYCFTPVFGSGRDNDERHVFSSIGVALDSEMQTDYDILSQIGDPREKLETIIGRVRKAYELFFACLDDMKLKRAALCILGSVSFATFFSDLCEGKDYVTDVWWKVVRPFVDTRKDVEFYLLGNEEEFDATKKKLGFDLITPAGRFPNNVLKDVSNVLFQNAWDPHSVVGNGHFGDYSLDGYVGRSTVVAPLTFPGTNVFMAPPRTIVGAWVGDLSKPTWKAKGEHAVTGHGTYRGERKFVKMVCLSRATVTIDNKLRSFSNANREVEVAMNARVAKMVESLRQKEDFRADYFLAAEVVRVGAEDSSAGGGSVPEWARPWIAEYEKHATVEKPQYAFLFMRDVSAGVEMWDWWGSAKGNTFRDRSIVLAQIVTALEALADERITHNDLHWSNIIVETIDPKDFREIRLGEFTTTPRFRPVLFDWDRAVTETVNSTNGQKNGAHGVDAFDPHYDLIGLYKNLTQNYRPKEQFCWRLLLHRHFEKTFKAFPSLALNHRHHANPCLSDNNTDSRRVRYAKEYQDQQKAKGIDRERPVDCKSEWSTVPGWNDRSLNKPSHADVVSRITAGLLPDSLMPVKTLFDALYVTAALSSFP